VQLGSPNNVIYALPSEGELLAKSSQNPITSLWFHEWAHHSAKILSTPLMFLNTATDKWRNTRHIWKHQGSVAFLKMAVRTWFQVAWGTNGHNKSYVSSTCKLYSKLASFTCTVTSTTQVGTVSCSIDCSVSPPASLHSNRYCVLPPTSLCIQHNVTVSQDNPF